jgi:hypothetical protein
MTVTPEPSGVAPGYAVPDEDAADDEVDVQHRPSSHELDRSNSAIRGGFTAGARCRAARAASIASCLPSSQSIAA